MTKSEFAVEILKKYAKEQGEIIRGTTDTSPLEQWLISELYEISSKIETIKYAETNWHAKEACDKILLLFK